MRRKKTAAFLLCALLGAAALFTGCGSKIKDTDQFLEVYCIAKGYGTQWLTDALDAFQQEGWVREKYPQLEVYVDIDDLDVTASNKLSYGAASNTTDLLFAPNLYGFGGAQRGQLADLTDTVYRTEVPGESVTVEEKMLPAARDNNAYAKESAESNVYYTFPWAGGMNGILYNETLLNAMGIEAPVTTDELVEVCREVSDRNDAVYREGYAIMSNNNDGYWESLFYQWWAQYEGMQRYSDFYYGLYGDTQSSDIFSYTGRKRALEVLEQLFLPRKQPGDYKYEQGKDLYRYLYPYANEASMKYSTAQTSFLNGQGVFNANGDWFDNEMQEVKKKLEEEGVSYSIKFMRTPVVSSIVEKLEDTAMTDETLAAVVREIDADATSSARCSAADFAKIRSARCVVASTTGLTAVVPSYASAKNVALDFLRYMATDECQKIYMRATQGSTLPFAFSPETDAELYESISDAHKSRLAILNDAANPPQLLPGEAKFPYGLKAFYSFDLAVTRLESQISAGKKTAEDIFGAEVDYWKNAGTKFAQIISSGS